MIKEFSGLTLPSVNRVAVLGAGPSMDKYTRSHFVNNYPVVIGVNWIYKRFEVTYNLATHFIVCHHVLTEKDCLGFIYSRQTSDVGMTVNNPKTPGIVFDADSDIWCGSSSIIPAIHFASMMSKHIDLYGVDLKTAGPGKMYCEGYKQETGNKPSDDHFGDWSEVVRRQIIGIQKLTEIKLIWYKGDEVLILP